MQIIATGERLLVASQRPSKTVVSHCRLRLWRSCVYIAAA